MGAHRSSADRLPKAKDGAGIAPRQGIAISSGGDCPHFISGGVYGNNARRSSARAQLGGVAPQSEYDRF